MSRIHLALSMATAAAARQRCISFVASVRPLSSHHGRIGAVSHVQWQRRRRQPWERAATTTAAAVTTAVAVTATTAATAFEDDDARRQAIRDGWMARQGEHAWLEEVIVVVKQQERGRGWLGG